MQPSRRDRPSFGLVLLLIGFALARTSPARAAGPIALRRVATGLTRPDFATAPPGDARLFVLENAGVIRVVPPTGAASTFLDLHTAVSQLSEEGGLLGLAFAPDYPTSGLFFLYYTAPAGADPVASIVIERFHVSANPDVADAASGVVLLTIPKPIDPIAHAPFPGHNGGTVAFGPDGKLYFATGDGDADALAQDDASRLGKLLRFDFGGSYANASPTLEVVAKGFRNPYRFAFDRTTGDLFIGDVGQNRQEEVDVLPHGSAPGANFGWRCKEGLLDYVLNPPCAPPLTAPIHTYPHLPQPNGGEAVIGGAVYRGVIPQIQGRYFFGDITNRIWSFVWDGGGGILDLQEHTADLTPDAGTIEEIVAISEDGFGDLLVVDDGFGGVGEVFRIVSTDPDADGDLVPDAEDDCPFAANRAQRDTGGIGSGSAPDGIGDACQCGDVNGDGSVTIGDASAIVRSLLQPPTVTLARPDLCDVTGDAACGVGDAVAVRRALLVPPTATIVQGCAPAIP